MTPTTHEQGSPTAPPSGAGSTGTGLTGAARDEAGHLRDTTVGASQQVTGTAKEKAGEVAADVRQQARQLAGETRDQVAQQASQQRDRAVEGLRSVGDELRGMAEHGQSGWAAQFVRQGADWTDQAADFLKNRGAGDILDDVRRVARRRPGTFLLVAAAAGVAAGRLSRAMAAGSTDNGSEPDAAGSTDSGSEPDQEWYGDTSAMSGVDTTMPGGTPTSSPMTGMTGTPGEMTPPADDRLMPPTPSPVAPDPDPGAPVQPGFGPWTGR
ncbi:MAG TPA: hypothetical protein VFT31_06430 [Kribbella sp.]|nr:hypothetical protein [Kribbella sp.]